MGLQLWIYIPLLVSVFLLGAVTLQNNHKQNVNRSFAGFSGVIFLWLLFSFLADTSTSLANAKLYITLAVCIASFLPLTYNLFCYYFPYRDKKANLKPVILLAVLSILSFLLTIFGFTIKEVSIGETGVIIESAGLLYAVQIAFYFAGALYGTILLFLKLKKSKGYIKSQLQLVTFAVGATAFLNIVTNGVLVLLGNSTLGPLIGSSSVILIVAAMSYAILKHRLFDIRLVVARSLGYILSISALSALYGLVSFTVINVILPESASINLERGTYTLLAVILAFTFQPLKKFFDRWSNTIFYRDAYDPQELLDDLNKVLVSTLETDKLLTSAATVIARNLKAEYVLFSVNQTNHSPQRLLGTVQKKQNKPDLDVIGQLASNIKLKTIITDEIDDTQANLREQLRLYDVATLVHLTETPRRREKGLGYMVLGNKKSGGQYTPQDIKMLEIIADELIIAIQNTLRFEEIQNFNITLQEKVDDATKQLRKANQRLIELDQTKDDFISMASHQLRTPLTSVKGYISMVMDGDAGKVSKKQNAYLDQAFLSAQRMVYLIADLLNVSRLRTGKFIIEPKVTNLAEVIESEIAQLKETAKGRNLELVYNKPDNFPNLMLDETKMRQVIMNFADNAIYYTPNGGHITVNLQDDGDVIQCTVIDDGIGVPKHEQHHMFNKFYRANNAKKTRPDGTGLGLFMAKKVVVAQGGSIIFSSQENKGSTFGFSFSKNQLLPENFKGVTKDSDKTMS